MASMRRMANSAQTVLPDPVGAATRQLSSVLYSAVNTCAHSCKPLTTRLIEATSADIKLCEQVQALAKS